MAIVKHGGQDGATARSLLILSLSFMMAFHGVSCSSQDSPDWRDAITGALHMGKQWSQWAAALDFHPWNYHLYDYLQKEDDSKAALAQSSVGIPVGVPPRALSQHHRKVDMDDEEICSGIGKIGFDMVERNTCDGEQCSVEEMDCGGVSLHRDQFAGYTQDSLAQDCQVTKMRCNVTDVVDMLDRHGRTDCRVDSVQCGSELYNSENATNSVLGNGDCSVQVVCNNFTWYGYNAYDFYCAEDEVVCNGTVIALDQLQPSKLSHSDCVVNKKACPSNFDETTICKSVQIECEGDTVSGCSLQKVSAGNCTAGSSEPLCTLSKISCNGTIVSPSSYNGSLSDCFVHEVSCGDAQVFDETSLGSNCTLQVGICNGTSVDSDSFKADCFVNRVSCPLPGGGCALKEFYCGEFSPCEAVSEEYLCENEDSCNHSVNTSICICPIDRIDYDCSGYREMKCTAEVVSPPKDCNNPNYVDENDPKQSLLDGDRACFVFSMDETAYLSYELDCAFVDPVGDIPQNVIDAGFVYYAQNDKFSVSTPSVWGVIFKIFNFNVLSDKGASYSRSLDVQQTIGTKGIQFNVTLRELPDRFWHGNRIYGELAWDGSRKPVGMQQRVLARTFLDSPEYKGKGTATSSNPTGTIVLWLIVALIGIGIVALLGWKYFWLPRKERMEDN